MYRPTVSALADWVAREGACRLSDDGQPSVSSRSWVPVGAVMGRFLGTLDTILDEIESPVENLILLFRFRINLLTEPQVMNTSQTESTYLLKITSPVMDSPLSLANDVRYYVNLIVQSGESIRVLGGPSAIARRSVAAGSRLRFQRRAPVRRTNHAIREEPSFIPERIRRPNGPPPEVR